MKKNRANELNELTVLLKKALQHPDSISNADKKSLKKLISDPALLVEAMQIMDPDFKVPPFQHDDDSRSFEEIIADNYIKLAKFTIEKMQLKSVSKLQVNDADGSFTIYALNPEPVELDLLQYTTSEYTDNKELLLEAEALLSDLFMEDNTEKYRLEIISRIESAIL